MTDNRPKIFERNPDTGVVRWRYIGESPDDYGWPHYGNILTEEEDILTGKDSAEEEHTSGI